MTNIHDLPIEVLEMMFLHIDDAILVRRKPCKRIHKSKKREAKFLRLSGVCRLWRAVILNMTFSKGTQWEQKFALIGSGLESPRRIWYRSDSREERRPAGYFLKWLR